MKKVFERLSPESGKVVFVSAGGYWDDITNDEINIIRLACGALPCRLIKRVWRMEE